jgi:hypothetical protein
VEQHLRHGHGERVGVEEPVGVVFAVGADVLGQSFAVAVC